jgi:hypothetical protein
VADETGSQFVDLPTALKRSAPDGLLGETIFYDHVHPSVAGHATIARVLAAAMGTAADGDPRPDIAALIAANPMIDGKIFVATTILYAMLGWSDRVEASLDAGLRRYPGMVKFRAQIEALQAQNPPTRWDDFPEEAD